MRVALALVLVAAPALAEPPRISLVFGDDRLDAQAEDILGTRRIDQPGRGSALHIRLVPAFDAAMHALTLAHVGATGELKICSETVLSPILVAPIRQAVFVITDSDPARIDWLEALLASPDCAEVPEG